jgi:hypothetical protein
MKRTGFRILLLTGTLFVLGCCCTARAPMWMLHPTPCTGQPQDHEIEVFSDHVSCDTAYVSKNAQHHVEWFCAKGMTLEIRFPHGSPFRVLRQTRDNAWQGFDVNVDPTSTPFKYDVYLNGKKVLDPGIIIMP